MRLDRLASIENFILQQGSTSSECIAKKFNMSVNTARRDIIELEKSGRIKRIRGGAAATEKPKSLSEIDSRRGMHAAEKEEIGYAASKIAQDGQTIYIDAGSTTKSIVKYLKDLKNITIITSSVSVLIEATKLPNVTLIVLGGEYVATSDSLCSYSAMQDLDGFNIDISFHGTTGLSIEGGLTTASFMEAKIKSQSLCRSKKRVIVADSSKFGVLVTSKFGEFSDADVIVSDYPLPPNMQKFCDLHQIKTICTRE